MTEESGRAAKPAQTLLIYCEEGRRLLDSFGEAVQEVLQLQEAQFQAIVSGDWDSHRFDVLIHMANDRKQNAKYAYLNHLELHGCSLHHGFNHG